MKSRVIIIALAGRARAGDGFPDLGAESRPSARKPPGLSTGTTRSSTRTGSMPESSPFACLYCHPGAERSRHAGIPSAQHLHELPPVRHRIAGCGS